jgi:magnesium transporter
MKIDLKEGHVSQEMLESPAEQFISQSSLTFSVKESVDDALKLLRGLTKPPKVEYFYVVDEEDVLVGYITTEDLLYSKGELPISELYDTDIVKVKGTDTLEKAFKALANHQLLNLPVVDKKGSLLGILDVGPRDDELLQKGKRKQLKTVKEALFQFIGFSIEQRKMSSTISEFRLRMPWLLCNLVGGLICAVIGEIFKETLIQYVLLALFIPLVLSLSESISVQAMTISLRFLSLKKIYPSQVLRRLDVEWKTSLLLGIGNTLLIALFYFAWSLQVMPIVAMGMSIIISMIFSALFGALFPIILHLLKLDPKVAAGPVVLTMADVITVIIYYGLTTWMLMP